MPKNKEKNGFIMALSSFTILNTNLPIKEIPFDMALPGEKDLDLNFFF